MVYQRIGGDMTDWEDDLRDFEVQIPQVRQPTVPWSTSTAHLSLTGMFLKIGSLTPLVRNSTAIRVL